MRVEWFSVALCRCPCLLLLLIKPTKTPKLAFIPKHSTRTRTRTITIADTCVRNPLFSNHHQQIITDDYDYKDRTMAEPEAYSEEFFAARIETLQNQIKEALPTLESSKAMQDFHQDCEVQWVCFRENGDLKALINKTGKGEEKDQLKKDKKEKEKEYDNLLKETWPERIKTGGELFNTEVDLAAMETVIMECTVLINSEPKRLAEFIAESWKNKGLWDEFVSDPAYMKKVLVNGGAHSGLIHKALKLHKDLRSTIMNDAPSEIRENLALAVALEFAVPHSVFKHDDQFVDPMERFWHYVNAFDRGELDKHFETLSVWELRMVVDCDATNEDLQWGKLFVSLRNAHFETT
jgi:hypothetical protein